MELMMTGGPKHDLARFGMEISRNTPRQADLMIVAGRVSQKMAPVLRQIYDQMSDPKWVISMGVCASSGGMFNNYAIVQGVDHIVPVDIYLPGCPPRPEMLLDAILKLHDKIMNTKLGRNRERQIDDLEQARLRMRPQHAGGADVTAGPFGLIQDLSRTGRAACPCGMKPGPTVVRMLGGQSSRTARSNRRRRSGSTIALISAILPRATVKPMTATGWLPTVMTTPAAPFTSTGRFGAETSAIMSVRPATAAAPWSTTEASGRAVPPSIRTTTSGSRTATSASRSPWCAAAKKASTTSRWRAISGSGAWTSAPRTRRRARLASCLAVAGYAPPWGDLVEGQVEHVVQDERQPLGRSQRFEHHLQRQPDRVGQQRLILGARPVRTADDRVGHVHAEGLLAPRVARTQRVQADPGDDRGQPGPEIIDAAGV
jgi:NADH-quinone oxidoreductase subunit B